MTKSYYLSAKRLAFFAIFLFTPLIGKSQLMITEIMFNPPESGTDSLEYIEVTNNGSSAVNLNGYNLVFANAVKYTFSSAYSLSAGGSVVFAVNSGAVQRNFNLTFTPFQWAINSGLSNTGSTIVFRNQLNDTLDIVSYTNTWMTSANGNGTSMCFCPSNADNSVSTNWFASTAFTGRTINTKALYGSPGVIECQAPTAYSVTGGGDYCSNGTGVVVGLSNSQSGVSYQLKIDGNNIGNAVTGTGNAISFGLQTSAGTYTVVATLNSQTTNMTGSAIVSITNSSGTSTTQTACGSYTWNNTVYTNSGTYTHANSTCDVDTLHLTITPITGTATTQSSCGSYTWNNTVYTNSGIYTHANSTCDVDTLHLTITPITGTSTTQSACGSYTWNNTVYTNSGTYTHANSTCDVDTLHLTISIIDTSVTVGSNVLTANTSNSSYQWYNCDNNMIISGETLQNYYPIISGTYAVIITQNGCVDTSFCHDIMIWGIEEHSTSFVNIAPNPVTDFVYFTTDETVEVIAVKVLDLNGKMIQNMTNLSASQNMIDVSNLNTGTYLLQFSTNQSVLVRRFIKN